MLLATLRGTGASTTPYYIHPDHLGSSEKTTDASGDIVELSDYYPFGSLRQNTQNGINDRKGYIGKDFDESTGLSQLGARYYSGATGRFISEDIAFLAVGNPQLLKSITGIDSATYLANPQNMNSYSYALNNPIRFSDPEGKFWKELINPELRGHLRTAVSNKGAELEEGSEMWKLAIDHPYATALAVGVAGGLFSVAASAVATAFSTAWLGGAGTGCLAACNSITNQIIQPQVGQVVGKIGTIIENAPQKITGFTQHGLAQIISREVSPQMLIEAVSRPLITFQQSGGTRLFLSQNAGVVLNKAGEVVTSYTSKQFNDIIQGIVKSLQK